MTKKASLILLLALCFPISAFSETILLKSGRIVEGRIFEKTDKYIKIDFQGVPITYFSDEIKSIDGVDLVHPVLSNGTAEKVLNEGIKYGKQGNSDKAILSFTKAIELNPNYAYAYFNRGIVYGEKGELNRSISDYTKAIELDPNNAIAYSNRALVYAGKENYNQTISDLTKAIEIKPDLALAYINRAGFYDLLGYSDKSILDYNKAIELDRNNAVAYFNRAVTYYSKREYSKAWTDIHKTEALGGAISPRFLDALKKTSGRDK